MTIDEWMKRRETLRVLITGSLHAALHNDDKLEALRCMAALQRLEEGAL